MTTSEQVLRTNEDIRKAFLRELASLLGKYTAEIEITGDDDNMEVYIPSKFNEENNLVQETLFINLGSWTNAHYLLDNLK